LERPRTEVDGHFARAGHIADQVGHRQQRLRITYNYAWTALWWYDDPTLLNALYNIVEKLAVGSDQARDIELLQNLWQLLFGSVHRGVLTAAAAKLDQRKEILKAEYDRLISDATRPNTAMQARTGRVLMSLYEAMEAQDASAIDKSGATLGKLWQILVTSATIPLRNSRGL
jgi:hypothetical protein